ncbi:MAG: 6,7-dimethyl-8-ribityllumazine synthase [Bifidobacteriaceae bacterium]|jgi:6,7-dimethyl-8-ribityllumazine synthase|nr:6,7-dimethyl-8-ribityllumazine synthase [Bifidobacteriaceae bacterium]
MAGSGAPSLDASGLSAGGGKPWRIAVVASLWHSEIMDGLVGGAVRALDASGAESWVVRVPGAFELPLAAKWCLGGLYETLFPEHMPNLGRAHGVVALGVVIRGGTPHFEYVCQAATSGLAQVALDTGHPVGFGVLTCDSEAEARDRAGLPGSHEDKGAEAAQAVLAMLNLPGSQPPGTGWPDLVI